MNSLHTSLQALKAHPEPSATVFFKDMRELYIKNCTYCVIAAMAEEDLFSAFQIPTSAEEVAQARGFPSEMLGYMCDICVRVGFLVQHEGRYHITPMAQTYLTADSPYSQRDLMRSMSSQLQTLWFTLSDRLHFGPLAFDREQFFREKTLPSMAASTLCGRLQNTLQEIVILSEFQSWRRVLDIGGGHGLYAIAMAFENPQMTAIVQDLPEVISLTKETIKEYGMKEQIKTIAGDYLECNLGDPESYDMVFTSSTAAGFMNVMSDRVAEILKPGGYFINVQPCSENKEDLFSQLEWMLWTFSGVTESKSEWKKGNPFPPPGYVEHLQTHGIILHKEVTISDSYREGFAAKMLIMKKME